MKKPIYINGQIFHVYNRGVEKRVVFPSREDYSRFIHNLFEFNDLNSVINVLRRFNKNNPGNEKKPRKLLVDILCFCLMPNHFHLLLKQRLDGGISKFLQKLGIGYTNYFNQKYERSGVLFQGKHKAVLVDSDRYLKHVSGYIHMNPIEIMEPRWKEKGIKNWQKVEKFLNDYRWSSFQDYTGGKNFPSLINKKDVFVYFNNTDEYKNFIKELAIDRDFNEEIGNLILE